MEKLSGLVLDAYDDTDGAVLTDMFSSSDGLPELLKTAHAITTEEHNALPDEAFAVVLVDGDVELRKFATIDAGNTALSVGFFLKTAHKMPLEAQKVAAVNLVAACQTFDLPPPSDLLKSAGMASMARGKGLLDPSTFKAMATKAHPRAGGTSRAAVAAPKAKPFQSSARSKLPEGDMRNPSSYLKSAMAKMALALQEMKANLDNAPDRPQKFKTHGEGYKKTACIDKEALGAMGAVMGAMVGAEQVGEARKNLAATRGSGGAVMTPRQVQGRRAQMGAF